MCAERNPRGNKEDSFPRADARGNEAECGGKVEYWPNFNRGSRVESGGNAQDCLDVVSVMFTCLPQ